jgi:hypothetical protein
MQDSKRQRPDEGLIDADATSKETLEDLEENEQSSDLQPKDESSKSPLISPDGTEDDTGDKTDDAGPM